MHPILLYIVSSAAAFCSLAFQTSLNFSETTAPLCIQSQFVETPTGVRSDMECAVRCARNDRCQAFSLHFGPCQLFVFDKCSKNVRDCGVCNRSGRLYIKQQVGLPAGALCPSGFSDDLCGAKYKLVAGTSWNAYKTVADAQPGLVIMADVMDATEWSHLLNITIRMGWTLEMFGGMQAPGSPEPAEGWYWVSCNIPLSGTSSLWQGGEPNNVGGSENYVLGNRVKLLDGTEFHSSVNGGFLECVSPFD